MESTYRYYTVNMSIEFFWQYVTVKVEFCNVEKWSLQFYISNHNVRFLSRDALSAKRGIVTLGRPSVRVRKI